MNQLDRYLPFGLTAETALVAMAATDAFLTVLGVWYGLLERDPMASRAKLVAQRRDELRRSHHAQPQRRRRQESLTLMRRIVQALKLLQSQQAGRLAEKLAQAGARSRDALTVFLFLKVATPVAFAVAAAFAFYVVGVGDLPPLTRLLLVAGGAGIGWFAPEVYLKNRIAKRQKLLQKALPDALDLLVICAEAGLSLDAGLDRVAREIGGSSPELAEELALTSVELGFLPERR